MLLQHVSAQFDFLCAAADAHVIETVIPLSLWKTEEVKNNSNKLRNHFARGKRPVMPVLAMLCQETFSEFFFIYKLSGPSDDCKFNQLGSCILE